MSIRKFFSPFADDEDEKPQPVKAAPEATATTGRQMDLASQLRAYLLDAMKAENPHAFCKRTGFPKSSLHNVLTGTGLHVHSLERLAKTLGWSVTITDEDGKPVARL